MQTKAKSNSVVVTTLQPDGATIRFEVRGAGPDGAAATFDFNVDAVQDANRRRALIHGFTQRISDKAAISRDTATGRPASPLDKYNAMRKLADHYLSGADTWSPAVTERALGLDSIILGAIVEVTGKTHDEIRAMITAGAAKAGVKPGEYLAALGTGKLVAPVVARIRGERTTGVDADAELDALMAGDGEE